jgi:hypothetical protein
MERWSITRVASTLAIAMLMPGMLLTAQTSASIPGGWMVSASSGIVVNANEDEFIAQLRTADLGRPQGATSGSFVPTTTSSGHVTQFTVGRRVSPLVEIRALFERADGPTVTGSNAPGTDPYATGSTFMTMEINTTVAGLMAVGDLNRFVQLGGGLETGFANIQRRDGAGVEQESKASPGLLLHAGLRGDIKQLVFLQLTAEGHCLAPVQGGPYNVHRTDGALTTVVQTSSIHLYHGSLTVGAAVRIP